MQAELESKKLDLIQWLSSVDDLKVLDKIDDIRAEDLKGWWSDISEEEKVSIANGVKDADRGNLRPHSEARKVYEKWL
ncbi:MAG: hypothetical protein RIF33_01355 [Cyclobacteriaceae bacterium]